MGLDKSNQNRWTGRGNTWLVPALILGVSVVIAAMGENAAEWLRYDRVWIGQGEFWRLASGHFTHLSWSHLALNGAGLLLVWFLVGSNWSLSAWISIIAITVAVMDIAFWNLNPELYWYVGISGLLHGLLAAGIVARYPDFDAETIVLLLLMLAKICWEQFAGPVPGSEITSGGPVVVDAHLYGAAGGAIAAVMARIRVKRQAPI